MPALLVALPLVFFGYGLAGWLHGWALGADSSVYRAGALLLLHGHSPYGVSDLGYLHLSFTYPPAAALLFTPRDRTRRRSTAGRPAVPASAA